ncbi:MAG: choice-of-anchor V domain-containing protein [Ignavibacteriaceae bacterium]
MRYYLVLFTFFISFIALSFSGLYNPPTEILGGTELNGNGCVCHSLERDYEVSVWIEGPDTLAAGKTGQYKMFLTGGPAEAGGYNVAGRFGIMNTIDSLSKWDYRTPNELIQAFPLVFPSTSDTIFWPFEYTATDSADTDTIYSVGLSLVFDGIPDSLDRWNFGPKFPIAVIEDIVPVELISFTANQNNNAISLNWITSSETNNMGFEVERQVHSLPAGQAGPQSLVGNWSRIGYVEGNGTTTESKAYSFIDNNISAGAYSYRLKQIDFDGSFNYSESIEVEVNFTPIEYELYQNYPNPFNPQTIIGYQISNLSFVILKVYDALGNEVVTLVNELKPAGKYVEEFDGSRLSSGVYYYSLQAGDYLITKKMLLIK